MNIRIILIVVFLFSLLTVQAALGSETGISKTIYPDLDTPFSIGIGDTAYLPNGIELTILNIVDSRCPSDVICIWQGETKISFNVIKDLQDLGNFILTSKTGQKDPAIESLDGYSIKLVQVEPYPYSDEKILLSDYKVTLVVYDTQDLLPPLKQFKAGIPINEIKCKPSLHLIIKLRNGFPACVREKTVERLVTQGWVINGKSTVILIEGQKEGSLLLQEIHPEHVIGLNFPEYPIARDNGLQVTLKIGDTVSNGCTITLTLEKIEGNTTTFSKVTDFGKLCPIC